MIITRLQAENFKKLRAIEIIPGKDPVVPIRGRNAQGKSSVLDAIQAALGGKAVMPSKPVRTGEDGGAVRLELDDGALVIRRTFDADGGGNIVVESAEGARYPSPQKMLDSLYASVAFDPLAFTREKPEDQYRILRRLVKLDVDPDALERQNQADYETRRDVNRDARQADAVLASMPSYTIDDEFIDEAPLNEKIAAAADHNGQIEARRVRREQAQQNLDRYDSDIAELEQRISELQQQLGTVRAHRTELAEVIKNAEPLPAPIDVSAVQAELATARERNLMVEAMRRRATQQGILDGLYSRADELTAAMEARSKQIAEAFGRAQMPVPGLSFANGAVLFNGEPFAQASSAEQLRVSTAIGMAGNPKLRVMLVRDGSLLDEEGERLLAEMAAEQEFQLWVEAVDSSGKVGIVMEDGAVKDAPEPAPIETGRRNKIPAQGGGGPEVGEGRTEDPAKMASVPRGEPQSRRETQPQGVTAGETASKREAVASLFGD